MFDTGDTWMMASSPVLGPGLWSSNLRTIFAVLTVIFQFWQILLRYVKFILIILLNYFRCLNRQCHEIFDFCFFLRNRFATVVIDTGGAPWLPNISARKNSKWSKWDTLGMGGNWFMQKNQKWKFSWHCPFKGTIGREDCFKHNEQVHRRLLSKTCRKYVL